MTEGTRQRRRAAVPLLWLLMVAAAAYVLSIYTRPQAGHSLWWDDWYYDAVLWSVALLTVWGARRGPQRGAGATALALAMTLYATGNTCWSVWVARAPNPPYPSIADFLWLSFYPLTFLAIWLMAGGPADPDRRDRRKLRSSRGLLQGVDGLIGALAVSAVGLLVSVGPIAHNVTGSPVVVIVNLAYPIGDLALLVLLISLTAASGRRPPVAWLLMGFNVVLWAVADSTYVFQAAAGTYHQGTLLDAGWLVPAALLAWVPWVPSRADSTHDSDATGTGTGTGTATLRPVTTLAIPALLAAVVVVLMVRQAWDEQPWFALLAGTTLAAAGARMVLSVREAERLAGARAEARTDELTGLGNRRAFLEALNTHLVRGERFRLLLMDLDGFKHVNDTLGHSAGDICLQTIAARMAALCPARRSLFRLGGDEFAILTSATPVEVAALVEELVAAVARPVPIGDQAVSVSASIGILVCPDQASTPAQALRRADAAMYLAKAHRLGHTHYTHDREPGVSTRSPTGTVGAVTGPAEPAAAMPTQRPARRREDQPS